MNRENLKIDSTIDFSKSIITVSVEDPHSGAKVSGKAEIASRNQPEKDEAKLIDALVDTLKVKIDKRHRDKCDGWSL